MNEIIEGTTSRKFALLKLVDYMESYGGHLIKDYAEFIDEKINIVCDLGVGGGRDLEILKTKFPGAKLVGVDFNNQNEEKLNQKGIELKVHNIETDELEIPDRSVDVIIINQVLEHVK
ncbi:MAG TPA: class I SAM-dependent methyltransferase, partial [Segetibacter sp.]